MYINSEALKVRIDEIAREANERIDRPIHLEEYIAIPCFGQIILRFMLEGRIIPWRIWTGTNGNCIRLPGMNSWWISWEVFTGKPEWIMQIWTGRCFSWSRNTGRNPFSLRFTAKESGQTHGSCFGRLVWIRNGKCGKFRLEDGAFTLLLMGTESRTIREMEEPVRLVVMETNEAACTGLMKAAMRSKRLGVSLGRLIMEMSR